MQTLRHRSWSVAYPLRVYYYRQRRGPFLQACPLGATFRSRSPQRIVKGFCTLSDISIVKKPSEERAWQDFAYREAGPLILLAQRHIRLRRRRTREQLQQTLVLLEEEAMLEAESRTHASPIYPLCDRCFVPSYCLQADLPVVNARCPDCREKVLEKHAQWQALIEACTPSREDGSTDMPPRQGCTDRQDVAPLEGMLCLTCEYPIQLGTHTWCHQCGGCVHSGCWVHHWEQCLGRREGAASSQWQ